MAAENVGGSSSGMATPTRRKESIAGWRLSKSVFTSKKVDINTATQSKNVRSFYERQNDQISEMESILNDYDDTDAPNVADHRADGEDAGNSNLLVGSRASFLPTILSSPKSAATISLLCNVGLFVAKILVACTFSLSLLLLLWLLL